jgi:hypothetical protein
VNSRQRQALYAAEHRHWRDRLLRQFDLAPADLHIEGSAWYPRAEEKVADLAEHYGISRPRVAGVIAALSPQVRWRENVDSAERILEGKYTGIQGYPANVGKASAIAAGGDPDLILGGDKVRAFWANLIGSREAVTVDTWAARAAYGLERPLPSQPKGTRYERIARAYRAAAETVAAPPRELQAIVWLAVRPTAEHEKDVAAIFA